MCCDMLDPYLILAMDMEWKPPICIPDPVWYETFDQYRTHYTVTNLMEKVYVEKYEQIIKGQSDKSHGSSVN